MCKMCVCIYIYTDIFTRQMYRVIVPDYPVTIPQVGLTAGSSRGFAEGWRPIRTQFLKHVRPWHGRWLMAMPWYFWNSSVAVPWWRLLGPCERKRVWMWKGSGLSSVLAIATSQVVFWSKFEAAVCQFPANPCKLYLVV